MLFAGPYQVVIAALDGATTEHMLPWIARGQSPTLDGLVASALNGMSDDALVILRSDHPGDGIFAVYGGPVRPGHFAGARIIYVPPTVLDLLGLPVSEVRDRQPVLDALEPVSVTVHSPLSDQPESSGQQTPSSGAEQEDRLIEERLRSLGYLA